MRWIEEKDSDGRAWEVCLQGEQKACAVATMFMVLRLKNIGIGKWDYKEFRALAMNIDLPYDPKSGSHPSQALYLAACYGLTMKMVSDTPANFVGKGEFPYIADVFFWTKSGKQLVHAVLVVGTTLRNTLVCLDPANGLVETPLQTLPTYQVSRTRDNRYFPYAGVGAGLFTGWAKFFPVSGGTDLIENVRRSA